MTVPYVSADSTIVRRQRRATERSQPARAWTAPAVLATVLAAALPWAVTHASDADDRRVLAALDTKYQRAVQQNDAKTMALILADDFVLVEGDGTHATKADLLKSATDGKTHYQHQEDSEQTVLVYGDTAVVTAKLWAKGLEDGVRVDYKEWFSDVYVRTPHGWRYVFGQASLPLPVADKH
jgi:ketosteroid isomerase-like protein